MIVGQNLHEEVQLQSLRLQDENRRKDTGRLIGVPHVGRVGLQAGADADLRLFALHAADAV